MFVILVLNMLQAVLVPAPAWEGSLRPNSTVSMVDEEGFFSIPGIQSTHGCEKAPPFYCFSFRLCAGYGGFPDGGQLLASNGNTAGKYGEQCALMSPQTPNPLNLLLSVIISASCPQVTEGCRMKLNRLLKPFLRANMVKTCLHQTHTHTLNLLHLLLKFI